MNVKIVVGSIIAAPMMCSSALAVQVVAPRPMGSVTLPQMEVVTPRPMETPQAPAIRPVVLSEVRPVDVHVTREVEVHETRDIEVNVTRPAQVEQATNTNQNISARNGAPQARNPNQKGLSQQQINQGCVIAGDWIKCPGQSPEFRHTFETPQFGRNWQLYVPPAAYTTENFVDNTRTLHTSVGANLPDNTLKIAANGTYLWKANGRVMQGRWDQADENTLVLRNAYKGKDWSATTEKFGADEKGKLVLWHDNEQLKGQ